MRSMVTVPIEHRLESGSRGHAHDRTGPEIGRGVVKTRTRTLADEPPQRSRSTGPALVPELCFIGVEVPTGEKAVRLLASAAVEQGFAHQSFIEAVVARGHSFPTGLPLPTPVALPHSDAQHVIRPALAGLVPTRPLTFGELGRRDRTVEAEFVLMLLVNDPQEELGLLMRLIRVLKAPDLSSTLLNDLVSADELAHRFQQLVRADLVNVTESEACGTSPGHAASRAAEIAHGQSRGARVPAIPDGQDAGTLVDDEAVGIR